MSQLTVRDLTVTISCLCITENFSREFNGGEVWALLGPNGAGKTTLLHTLAGLHAPDQGQVLLDATAMATLPRKAVARQLGLLQQHTAYLFDATVMEIALMGRHPHLGLWQQEDDETFHRVDQALKLVGLDRQVTQPATQLSGGEARRLAVATLLVQDPDIVLLDEPTNHLDPAYQRRIMQVFRKQAEEQNNLLIMATHDLNLASRYCSHVLLLKGDGSARAGPAAELMTRTNLESLYGTELTILTADSGQTIFAFL